MKSKLALALVALAALGLFAVFARGFGKDPREVPFMLSGKPAPAFKLRALDTGEEVSLEALKGQPVVINFWASWCGPCKSEHPVLTWGAQRLGRQARFVGVIFEDTEDNARAFLREHGNTGFPQLVDPRSTTAVDFGVAGVPETYFIDSDGVIRGKHVGPVDPDTLVQRVQELAAAPR